jgi:aldehyde:ferredoxin oxidoreductase
MKGYAGKILHVNLTDGRTWIEEPPELFYRRYLGGQGFIAYYLLKEVPRNADPLGPENVLIFATGTVTAVPVAGAGRNAVGAKSPLTGGYGEGDVGGFFGAELKLAGYDAVLVHGQAPKPVYMWIKDDQVEIRPAEHLWGMTTLDLQETIRIELGDPHARLTMIGPAGEKLARVACVMNDATRAAGRTGLGAVMGSKNLKAIAARGTGRIPLGVPEDLRALSKWMRDHWQEDDFASDLHDSGTASGVMSLNEAGQLPTRNFQDGIFEGAEKITGQAMRDTILTERTSCYACAISCKRGVRVADDEYRVTEEYGGPEYETIGSLGSNCGIDDLRAIAKGNELCNAYGLDTIGTGMMVSFAMECFENGLLTPEDTGGLDLRFGNGQAMVELIRQMGERQGLGDLLAEGPRIAAARIGKGAEQYAIHVKGQPFPMHECRTRHGQALGYAVSPTGADHVHNFWDGGMEKEPLDDQLLSFGVYTPVPQTELNAAKVRAYVLASNWAWLDNHLGMCMFIPWSVDQTVDLVRAITGWKTNVFELQTAAERGVTLARVFNLREGFTRRDDVLPRRMNSFFKTRSLNEKPVDPEVLDENVSTFYAMMGWDPETGAPTVTKLQELDVEWAAQHLPAK